MKKLLIVILSYLEMISLAQISHMRITTIEFILPCLFAVACIMGFQTLKIGKWEDIKLTLLLGSVFALTTVVGSHIDIDDAVFSSMGFLDILYFIVLSVFFCQVFLLLFYYIDKYGHVFFAQSEKKGINKRRFLLSAGFLFTCWLPYYLTFLPGNIGRDTTESVNMCLGNIPWTNHHPVFFTFLFNVVIKLTSFANNLNFSMGVFSFSQMVVFALTLGYVMLWLYKHGIKEKVYLTVLTFFAFHPIIAMYSIYQTKDVLFSCLIVLLVLKLFDITESKGIMLSSKKQSVILGMLSLDVILLRNNGLLIIAGVAVVMMIIYRKFWKSVLFIFGCVFAMTALYKGPVFHVMGIEKQSFAESASIPLQQVGYVIWNEEEMEKEETAYLEKLMPFDKVREVYEPGYTDPYKFDEAFNDEFLNEDAGKFIKVWWKLLPDHFPSYVKAYLMQTVGYWHYGETNSVCTQGVTENKLGIRQYDVIKEVTGFSLEPVFEKLILAARKAPLLCILSSMAMQILMVFICLVSFIKKGRKDKLLALVPCIVLWLSIMVAAPAFCLLRYLFPLFLLWPVLGLELVKKD